MATIKDKTAAKSKTPSKANVAPKTRAAPKNRAAPKTRATPKANVAPKNQAATKASVAPRNQAASKARAAASKSKAAATTPKTAATTGNATVRKTQKPKAPAAAPRQSKRSEIAADVMSAAKTQPMPVSAAVNAKLADIARTNMNAGLELACGLATAKSPMEAMRLGLAYWYDNIGVFRTQAQELRALSANLMTIADQPIRRPASRR